jgi:hypothetical protein
VREIQNKKNDNGEGHAPDKEHAKITSWIAEVNQLAEFTGNQSTIRSEKGVNIVEGRQIFQV